MRAGTKISPASPQLATAQPCVNGKRAGCCLAAANAAASTSEAPPQTIEVGGSAGVIVRAGSSS